MVIFENADLLAKVELDPLIVVELARPAAGRVTIYRQAGIEMLTSMPEAVALSGDRRMSAAWVVYRTERLDITA